MFAPTLGAASGFLHWCVEPPATAPPGLSIHRRTPRVVHLTETTQGPLAQNTSSAKLAVFSQVFLSQTSQEENIASLCSNFYWRAALGRSKTVLLFRTKHWN